MAINEITEQNVDQVFKYHPPTEDQIPRYHEIREGARGFAKLLLRVVPRGADRSAALRHLRECVMNANAAVALERVGVTPESERD